MGKIIFIMGKSSSGKDTVYRKLCEDSELGLKTVIMYTTRPKRVGEMDGKEYYFRDEEFVNESEKHGKIVELRAYNTIEGVWRYFTLSDEQIDIESNNNYIVIGTLEAYNKYSQYFGIKNIMPVYIQVDNGERLSRALLREKMQDNPKYEEMCRRFLSDEKDFSEENLVQAGVQKRYINDDLDICLKSIKQDIIKAIN